MVTLVNTLGPRQNGRHFADDTFKYILLNENVCFSNTISLKYVPWGVIDNKPALVQIMAWIRTGNDGIVYKYESLNPTELEPSELISIFVYKGV